MGTAFDDFQICKQCAVIQCGRNLTDTTTQSLNSLTGRVGIRVLIAGGGSAFADDRVEVKSITGIKDKTVDLRTGQPQIVVAVLIAGMLGLEGTQNITEQELGHIVAHDLWQQVAEGDLDGVAVLCLIQQKLGLF